MVRSACGKGLTLLVGKSMEAGAVCPGERAGLCRSSAGWMRDGLRSVEAKDGERDTLVGGMGKSSLIVVAGMKTPSFNMKKVESGVDGGRKGLSSGESRCGS